MNAMRSLGASVAILIGFCLAWGSPSYGRGLNPSAATKIDDAAKRFISGGYGPGVSVAVMQANEVIFARGYGMANLETETPVTPDTVFRAGSITKQFTAACIMRLLQAGRLSLDDRVSKYLPELTPAGAVTVRMLLTHTSGLHPYTDKPFQKEVRLPHTTQQMIDFIASQRPLLDFNPGTQYRYSNSNFYLMGAIIERLTGESLRQYMQSTIIADAGLTQTSLDQETDVVAHRASGYAPIPGRPGGYTNAEFISMDPPGGAGALRSTALDLARWHQALFAGRVVSMASLQQMIAPGKLANGQEVVRGDAPITRGPPSYGFGLELGKFDGEPTVAHGGAIPGFTAYVVTFPRLKLTIAMMTNAEPNIHEPFEAIERAVLTAMEQ